MKYLKAEDVLVIHSEIIDKTGGMHGLRAIALFTSIIEKPKSRFGGKDLYNGVFMKAAVYLEALVQYHVFLDGNKRTGIVTASRFLFLNKYELIASNKEVENFVLRVAVEKLDTPTIATWLKKHSKKLR